MKQIIHVILFLTIIFSIIFIPSHAEASEGLPGSPKFGYGARIDINGEFLEKSIEVASSIGLDWVAVEFNWGEMWSDPRASPMLDSLSEVILHANQNGLSVLLTITNPPPWLMAENGPDPLTTANLVLSLVNYYSGKVLAVELFPGANTKENWKAIPNPTTYLKTLKQTHETLIQAGKQISLVTTLSPVALNPSSEDIDDLDFLSDLYTSGGKQFLTIVGVKYNNLTGQPLTYPSEYTLRHYEEVRSIMLKNDHNHGTLWITGFSLPAINNMSNDQLNTAYGLAEEQSNWVVEAYKLMRAQLYIGVSFFDQINPNLKLATPAKVTIISKDSDLHSMANGIQYLIEDFKYNNEPKDTYTYGQDQDTSLDNKDNFLSALLKKILDQLNFTKP